MEGVENTRKKAYKWLNEVQRQAICVRIWRGCSKNGKAEHGVISSLAAEYGVARSTLQRLWNRAKARIGEDGTLLSSRQQNGHCGRKKRQLDLNKIKAVKLRNRTTVRSLADALGLPKTIVHRGVADGIIRRHSNAIKPKLSEVNKKQRVNFCLSMIDRTSPITQPKFINFYNSVHIDEKWFYITKEAQNFYLLPEELDPLRTCQSKRFITKVMFLTAVARPRFDVNQTGAEFDGKIGMWPFTYKGPAKRGSKNRPAGTIETKSLNVTQTIYRAFLVGKVLPAILRKWPNLDDGNVIYIQQDNARPHIQVTDAEFEAAAASLGLNAKLVCQPPNSPDLNVLDLGYFRSIEALQQKKSLENIDELVAAVEESFMQLAGNSLNHVFLSLQQTMIEILKVQGCDNYKLQHMNKNGLERRGLLPVVLPIQPDLIEASLAFLHG